MIKMPLQVVYILDTLKKNGYEAFVVGGCIRDVLMNNAPKDWDISTDALPQDVKKLFRETLDIGEKYGTIGVKIGHEVYEVTTYRCDEEYCDNRRPSKLAFSKSVEEDLSRRDFTINAMAYNKERGLIDLFEGLKHLKEKKIVCVGNPLDRFEEDALRIMRGIRFAVSFHFEIEPHTKEAMRQTSRNLRNISIERINDEFTKILLSQKPSYGMALMKEASVLDQIVPELVFDEGKSALLDDSIVCLPIRLALLYHDLETEGAAEAKKIVKRFRYAKKIVSLTILMIDEKMNGRAYSDIELKKLIRRISLEHMELFLLFMGQVIGRDARDVENLERLKRVYKRLVSEREPLEIRDLAVQGRDLLEMGFERGVQIGELLNELLEYVYKYPQYNQKDLLKEFILREFR